MKKLAKKSANCVEVRPTLAGRHQYHHAAEQN